MKKNLVHAAFGMFMLIVFTTSAYPQWVQTNWPTSNNFFNLYTNQDKVFARIWDSNNGSRVFLTDDNGENWTQISSTDNDVDILSILMWNNNILAGTWNGFYTPILDSTNWSWYPLTLNGIPEDTAILSIAIVDSNLFAGTKGDIYKSPISDVNGWTEVSTGIPANTRITSIMANGNAIFAGSDSNGVYITTNSGTSWTAINSGLTDKRISQLTALDNKLYAVTLTGLFVSESNGMSWVSDANVTKWKADSSGLKNINCLLPVNNLLFAGTDNNGAYISNNNGLTWAPVSSGIPAKVRIWSLALSGNNIFAGTTEGIWRINPADINNYTIAASALEGGTISPQGNVIVYKNGSQPFTITPALGYRINNVLVDGSSAGAVNSYTFSNVTANHTISASFTAVPIYTITSSAGEGGTISPSGNVMVSETWSQKFTITPFQEYVISTVVVDGNSVGAVSSYTFTYITGNHTISATFSKIPYTIITSTGIGGSISPSGAVTVLSGSSQTFTITPSAEYEIANVFIDGIAIGAVTSHTFSNVTSNHSINVTFNSISSLIKYQINCGGSAFPPYTADQYYSGGSVYSTSSTIDTNGVTDPAPQMVYRTERRGTSTYTLAGLTSGASYKVRLHFSENSYSSVGIRRFNVTINNITVLSNYDIYAETGARYKAVVKEFTATADTSGKILISFITISNNAKIGGIEIIRQL
jgi:hypothetical protein